MTIAAFDPSLTHFGWVLLDETKDGKESFLNSGTFKTGPSDGLLVHRLILQRERVQKFLLDNKIQFVAMEAPYWMDFSTELLFALNQYVHEVFLNLDMFIFYIQPQSLKKFACPNLKTNDITKHHMVHQAKTELGLHGKRFSEHVSDAYFAGKLGVLFHKWFIQKTLADEDLSEYLRELFYGKHTFVKGTKKGLTEYNGIIYKENDQFFDYKKQTRKTQTIISEVQNGN
jgi:Holliday junction resolvasome RuvABC endonuclease subunit